MSWSPHILDSIQVKTEHMKQIQLKDINSYIFKESNESYVN